MVEPIHIEWSAIADAGGIDSYIEAELTRRGLLDPSTDPSRLSEAEKKIWKGQREEERRVRGLLLKACRVAYKSAHLVHLGSLVHFTDTADLDRYDIADPVRRRQDNALPDIPDAQALAKLLGLPIGRLRWLVFHREVDSGTHYRRFFIPKRSGGQRLISAPKKDLKDAQRWVAQNISEHLPIHEAAHGFVPGRSTKTNAYPHAGARVVVKLDISDFYPTVTVPRVKGVFRKAGYGEQVATLLALLSTESPRQPVEIGGKTYYVANGARSLPQGAPTSPSLTNTLCRRLDARLLGLAKKLGWVYTRYADDMTFSWRRQPGQKPQLGKLIHAARLIISAEGFVVHPNKTRVMRSGGAQRVTGLVVNSAPGRPLARVPREYVRRLRAALHHREHGRPGQGETLAQLRGWAAYIYMTDPVRGRAFLERIARLEGQGAAP